MLLIDAIGPFFRHYKPKRVNWSKIPFHHLEDGEKLRSEVEASVPVNFEKFCRKVKSLGYTGITLDDVAHLVKFDAYRPELNRKIDSYRALFSRLFAIAQQQSLKVFVTTDIAFFNPTLSRLLGSNVDRVAEWLADRLSELLSDFPQIDGIITRFGETDGVDVEGDFRSQLLLKRPSHVREFLQKLLPVFERFNRLLIFRTWSVGAYQVGDMTWNSKTFHRVFDSIRSPNLVISMKFGESDFFRYLPTNPLFFVSRHKKIVEFQARREYEGFGAYPSFVGWDAESHLKSLQRAHNLIGASVWCQTGGWGKLRQLTFIRRSSPWVELNAYVIPRLFQGESCDEALHRYCQTHLGGVDPTAMIEFLRLSDEAIENLLYVREFAERRLFFRRLRLPPQIFVFWDRILVDNNIKQLVSQLVHDRQRAIDEGQLALEQLKKMGELARQHGLPKKGLKYQQLTFEVIAAARDYYFGTESSEAEQQLRRLKTDYKKRLKRNYSIQINLTPSPLGPRQLRFALAIALRSNARYRLIDQLITLRLLAWLYPLAKRLRVDVGPKFANQQAMGIEALFK